MSTFNLYTRDETEYTYSTVSAYYQNVKDILTGETVNPLIPEEPEPGEPVVPRVLPIFGYFPIGSKFQPHALVTQVATIDDDGNPCPKYAWPFPGLPSVVVGIKDPEDGDVYESEETGFNNKVYQVLVHTPAGVVLYDIGEDSLELCGPYGADVGTLRKALKVIERKEQEAKEQIEKGNGAEKVEGCYSHFYRQFGLASAGHAVVIEKGTL